MANKYTTLSGLFTAIADAIRSKTSGSAQIVADDFPEAISDLVSGSDYRGQNLISTIAQGTSYTQNGIEAKIRSDLSPAVIDENSKIVIPNSAIVSLLGITSKKIVSGNTIAGVAGTGGSKPYVAFYNGGNFSGNGSVDIPSGTLTAPGCATSTISSWEFDWEDSECPSDGVFYVSYRGNVIPKLFGYYIYSDGLLCFFNATGRAYSLTYSDSVHVFPIGTNA